MTVLNVFNPDRLFVQAIRRVTGNPQLDPDADPDGFEAAFQSTSLSALKAAAKELVEVRSNTDVGRGNEPCDVCLRYRERNIGDREMYFTGTKTYICWDCAYSRGLIEPQVEVH